MFGNMLSSSGPTQVYIQIMSLVVVVVLFHSTDAEINKNVAINGL